MKANTTTIFLAAIATAITVAGTTAALPVAAVFAQPITNTPTQTMDGFAGRTSNQDNSESGTLTATENVIAGSDSSASGLQTQTLMQSEVNSIY